MSNGIDVPPVNGLKATKIKWGQIPFLETVPDPMMSKTQCLLAEGLLTWLPFHRAELAGLERCERTNDFADRAAHAGVIDLRPAELSVWIDEEGAAEREAFVFHEHAVLARHFTRHVGEQRVFDLAEAVLDPRFVAVLRVRRAAENNSVELFELVDTFAELGDLGWADEGEVEWVEEQDGPLAA